MLHHTLWQQGAKGAFHRHYCPLIMSLQCWPRAFQLQGKVIRSTALYNMKWPTERNASHEPPVPIERWNFEVWEFQTFPGAFRRCPKLETIEAFANCTLQKRYAETRAEGPLPTLTQILQVDPLLFVTLAESFAAWVLEFELARRDIFHSDAFLPDPHLSSHESFKQTLNYALAATGTTPALFATITLHARQRRQDFGGANALHIAANYLAITSENSIYSNCTYLLRSFTPILTKFAISPSTKREERDLQKTLCLLSRQAVLLLFGSQPQSLFSETLRRTFGEPEVQQMTSSKHPRIPGINGKMSFKLYSHQDMIH